MRLLAAGCFALAILVGCGEGGQTSSTIPATGGGSTPPPLLMTPPAGKIYLGVYVNPSQIPSPPPTLLSGFEQSIGRNLALSTHYYGFYDTFPGPYEADDIAHGRIPIDSWDCQPPNAAIAAGKDDAAIIKRADAIKAFGYPIFLRYMWEMNLPATINFRWICYDPATDLPEGEFSPQEYIAAWDHIRAIFAQQGVSNVIWVWNPSGSRNPISYYPGASEVDWTGFDKYDDANLDFFDTYAQAYSFLAPLGKPILVGETGATEQIQPTFFADAPSVLENDFPLIKGFVYFDSMNVNFAGSYSWVIGNGTLSNFAAMANNPYLSATEPPLVP
jgi:hypothetical protein